jgi:peptide/nickel transport system substrate-binding protein
LARLRAVTAAAFMLAAPAVLAQDLRIGTRATPTLDPHFLFLGTNLAFHQHIYGRLVERDDAGHYGPGLATSWELAGPTRWRFHLRRGVTFQDGKPFTADDVVFSFARVSSLPNNPAPYTSYLTSVVKVEKVDEGTVDIVTSRPNPLIPIQTNGISILSKSDADGKLPADFANGSAAIGTGPYRVVESRQGERLVLERYDGYWGPKPYWQHVEFRVMPNGAGRTAALLAGDVDLIDTVSPTDADRLAATPGIAVHKSPTSQVIYLGATIDLGRSPLTTDKAGQILDRNPFADVRVRRAISLAVNRPAIVDRIMGGYAASASQLATPGMAGFVADRKPDPFAAADSQRLMKEAGWDAGFKTSLTCPGDRYVGDAAICQALGQMLSRIGIQASVEVTPASVYFSKLHTPGNPLPLFLLGWGNPTGDATVTLTSAVHSYDREHLLGSNNRSGFADPEVDRLIDASLVELDDAKRVAAMTEAMRLATDRYAVIPLVQPMAIWASRAAIDYLATDDERTLAMRATARPK